MERELQNTRNPHHTENQPQKTKIVNAPIMFSVLFLLLLLCVLAPSVALSPPTAADYATIAKMAADNRVPVRPALLQPHTTLVASHQLRAMQWPGTGNGGSYRRLTPAELRQLATRERRRRALHSSHSHEPATPRILSVAANKPKRHCTRPRHRGLDLAWCATCAHGLRSRAAHTTTHFTLALAHPPQTFADPTST